MDPAFLSLQELPASELVGLCREWEGRREERGRERETNSLLAGPTADSMNAEEVYVAQWTTSRSFVQCHFL